MDNVELTESEEYKDMLKRSFTFLGIYLLVAIFMIGLFWFHPAFILSFVWGHIDTFIFLLIAMLILAGAAALDTFGGLAAFFGFFIAWMLAFLIVVAYMWASGVFSLGV